MGDNDFFEKMAKEIIKSMAIARLKSASLSKYFAEVDNKDQIEKNIDKISEDIVKKFLLKIESNSEELLSENEFKESLIAVVNDYFGDLAEDKNKT